jgi:NAD(P) transhydrogenase subunit alpha
MIVGVPKETFPGERRVALVPAGLAPLVKAKIDVVVEAGAGVSAGFPAAEFAAKGAKIATRADVFTADVVVQVRAAGACPKTAAADLLLYRKDQVVIAFAEPLWAPAEIAKVGQKGAALFAMELIPRITRAQAMDALSSMATIAGYKAVLLAAAQLPRMFPLLMTAAGTIKPARVLVVGAGVAGLMAIGTARRLGAVVEGYDVRPAVKEQVESLGAKFVELDLQTAGSEDKGGYAKAQDEAFYERQRELMGKVVAADDVVITTAAIPGKKSPVLVTAKMVAGMAPGSVVVDLAAERGGNCELTKTDETVVTNGVTILGPSNLPSTVPYHASQMYAKNVTNLLLHLVKDGAVRFDLEDQITRETLVTKGGEVVNPRIQELLAKPAAAANA